MLRPNSSSYPSNTGWVYDVPGGGQLVGDDRLHLIRKLAEHNARVGNVSGGEEHTVDAFICARNPGICHDDNAGQPAPVREYNADSLRARAQTRLGEAVHLAATNRLPRVSAKQASDRAAICRACPRNVDIPPCVNCEQAMRESRAYVVARGPEFDRTGLRFCASFATDLHVTCSLELSDRSPDAAPTPGNCWRLNGG